MEAIECVSLPQKHKWLEREPFRLELDIDILRKMVSWITRLRMSMAQKRMEKEPYKAKKCIFHALRYLTFAIQVVTHGAITDYTAANHYLKDIMDHPSFDWQVLKDDFGKKVFNPLREAFLNCATFNDFYSKYDLVQHVHVHLFNTHNVTGFLTGANDCSSLSSEAQLNDQTDSPYHIVTYLRANGLGRLVENYKIRALPHAKHPNLIHFSSTIASPDCKLVQEAAYGIVLDQSSNWSCVSSPPFQFLNDSSPESSLAANIQWDNCTVVERIDGLQATLYWYQGEWHVSSKWEPDCMTTLCYKEISQRTIYKDLFWKTWNAQGYTLPTETDRCYTFALCTNKHRFVVCHSTDKLYLLAVRNRDSAKELDPQLIAQHYGWTHAPVHPELLSWGDVVAAAQKLNPFMCAGFIVVDNRTFNRVGAKSKQHLAVECTIGSTNVGFGPMNLNADNLLAADIIELIRWGAHQTAEFLQEFPQWRQLYARLMVPYEAYCQAQEDKYLALLAEITAEAEQMPTNCNKDRLFASKASTVGGESKAVLFDLKKHTVLSAREFIQVTRAKGFLKHLMAHMV
eukprot:TRINITY_DN4398_c0_g1_i2.p1 TRINITY_DN4398_c0_g1~~TRINITY_DN4398_c0_g1_i2.p1  ORF type:complete len:570 (+),score=67.43 TRINITY_DN4398_c0_g1_i2:508-2217(+)